MGGGKKQCAQRVKLFDSLEFDLVLQFHCFFVVWSGWICAQHFVCVCASIDKQLISPRTLGQRETCHNGNMYNHVCAGGGNQGGR